MYAHTESERHDKHCSIACRNLLRILVYISFDRLVIMRYVCVQILWLLAELSEAVERDLEGK